MTHTYRTTYSTLGIETGSTKALDAAQGASTLKSIVLAAMD